MKNKSIDSVLGQKVDSPSTYTPDILVREERQGNRTYLGLQEDKLPFVGYDIWNGYECSCLTDNGLPVTCIAKVVYLCTNKYIVESKSMKLYWNSFNMEKMGKTPREALLNLKKTTERDLSKLLETKVRVGLFSQVLQDYTPNKTIHAQNWLNRYNTNDTWIVLEDISSALKTTYTKFKETPEILVTRKTTSIKESSFMSSLLRSNCRITKQPDSGDIYIYTKGNKIVTDKSLLEYIISFRNECNFHETIVETVYKRLYDILDPTELLVTAFYARRGGWDIVPTRASHEFLLDKDLININATYFKFPKQ